MNKTFYVAVAYVGECCVSPHARLYRVRAKTAAKAIASVQRRIDKENIEGAEMVAMPVVRR